MSKIAFIYPGQGAQIPGMGKDFYENSESARATYDEASELLQIDMKQLCFEKNELLNQTEYTQAAMVTPCLAMTKVVEEKGLHPDVTAGLSLGEYCAISTAGGMKVEDAIRLVRKRGILMQNTVPIGEGAMAAILGMKEKEIEMIVEKIPQVSVANYNCPGQIVITGKTKNVEEAVEALKEAGAKRAVLLNVSGPFHSPMLESAGRELEREMAGMEFMKLKIPYVTNVTADYVKDIEETKGLLAKQVSAPVRWQESMEKMISEGVDTFVEIGPGKTLNGFLRKIDRSMKIWNIQTWEDVDKVANELC